MGSPDSGVSGRLFGRDSAWFRYLIPVGDSLRMLCHSPDRSLTPGRLSFSLGLDVGFPVPLVSGRCFSPGTLLDLRRAGLDALPGRPPLARDAWPGTWRWRLVAAPVVGLLSPGAVREFVVVVRSSLAARVVVASASSWGAVVVVVVVGVIVLSSWVVVAHVLSSLSLFGGGRLAVRLIRQTLGEGGGAGGGREGPFKLVAPVIATIVEPLDEPLAGQLRVAPLVDVRVALFCSASLGLYFFRLQFLQTFRKLTKGFRRPTATPA